MRLTTIAVVVALFSGCGAGAPDAVPSNNELFSSTRVLLDGRSATIMGTEYLTRQEVRAKNEARLAARRTVANGIGGSDEAISHDTSCAGTDIFLYDQTGEAGDIICFNGSGQAQLDNYCIRRTGGICLQTWSASVRSFWPGNDGGALVGVDGSQGFSANTGPFNTNTYGTSADRLNLD